MIKYVDGDLLELAKNKEFDVIGHCANCFCTFGAGIALGIKNQYPEAYIADCETISGDLNKLGKISFVETISPIIVNLYGQYDYKGRRQGKIDLDYVALKSSLKLMKDKYSGKKFGLPMIGAGLAGGDWNIIEKIIEEVFRGEYVTVVKYVPTR